MDEVALFARAFYRELELAMGEEEAGAITVEVSSPVSSETMQISQVSHKNGGCLSRLSVIFIALLQSE